MITPSRFRIVEGLLTSLLGASAAELISMLIAGWAAENGNSTLDAARIFATEEPHAIDVGRLAVASERDMPATWEWVRDAQRTTYAVLDLMLFDGVEAERPPKQGQAAQVRLSRGCLELLNANALYRLADARPRERSLADSSTRHWLDLIGTCVRQEAGAAFLYRRSGLSPAQEYGPLLSDLRERLGDRRIFIASRSRFRPPILSTAGVLLSALLHCDADDLVILPHPSGVGSEMRQTETDEEAIGEELSHAASAGVVLALIAAAKFSLIATIDQGEKIDRETMRAFAGAFGPYRLDLSRAAEALVASSEDQVLGSKEAYALASSVGDPENAGGILRAASALAWAACNQERTDGDLQEADEEDWHDEVFESDLTKGSDRPSGTFALHYNRLANDLAQSFIPNLSSTGPSYEFGGLFDPELFISEPSAATLFERAAFLREAGARLILAGPPGTGKTRFVGELARRMGLSIAQHGGAQLFAREWGQAERNILKVVHRSRGSVLFLDEADGLMGARNAGDDANQHLVVTATNAFLSAIQEPHPNSPIVAATNRLDAIDVGIRRRFDLILETGPIPEEKEILAWQRILRMEPPPYWTPISGTVPADYTKAVRQLSFYGDTGSEAAARALMRARDERVGVSSRREIGYLANRAE